MRSFMFAYLHGGHVGFLIGSLALVAAYLFFKYYAEPILNESKKPTHEAISREETLTERKARIRQDLDRLKKRL